jgi:filamin
MAEVKKSWQDIQQNTFTRWCNDYLGDRGMKINDLKTDLKDGIFLINLLEAISGKSLGRYNKHPKIPFQKGENLNIALAFIKEEGIKLVNIGADDIQSGNMRIILGLIWTLILRYEIKSGSGEEKDASNELLKWIQSKIPEYNIKGFTSDWNDGRAICALVDAIKPGLCPDHKKLDPKNAEANCKKGIDSAWENLAVDKLVLPDEMAHPKVDRLAMMTYLAQFRNIKPADIKKQSEASQTIAHGPGLIEGLAGVQAPFTVEGPPDMKGKLEIKVYGPKDEAKVEVKNNGGGNWSVTYLPTEPGTYKIHVTVDKEHIPGSIFTVQVLKQESLGGEGKIRVFYSTTASAQKSRSDRTALERMLQAKKIHLRPDFEPWHAVDIMDREDREAVFRRAGTRALPIVFIDDEYIGDYDKVVALEEGGKLDSLLNMGKHKLFSEEEHSRRLHGYDISGLKLDDGKGGAQ